MSLCLSVSDGLKADIYHAQTTENKNEIIVLIKCADNIYGAFVLN